MKMHFHQNASKYRENPLLWGSFGARQGVENRMGGIYLFLFLKAALNSSEEDYRRST